MPRPAATARLTCEKQFWQNNFRRKPEQIQCVMGWAVRGAKVAATMALLLPSPNRSRLLPTSVTLLSGRTPAIAGFGWGGVGGRFTTICQNDGHAAVRPMRLTAMAQSSSDQFPSWSTQHSGPLALRLAVAAVMFSVHKPEQRNLFRERCHANLHLAWSFHCRRREGHAG